MDLTRFRHIVTVARTASFSRAAKELHITQPALSRSISSFEERYGVRLFERGRSGTVPTAVGRTVVAQAHEILSATREMEAGLGAHSAGDAGEVILGLGALVASLILPPLGRHILTTRPSLKLRTVIKPNAALLAEDELDLLLASPHRPDVLIDFDVRALVRLQLAIVVRADHPLVGRETILASELKAWPAAGQTYEPSGANAGRFACENYHILRDVITSSDCYWCTSPLFIAKELADNSLCILNVIDYPIRDLEIAVMRVRGRQLSPAALAVEEEAIRLLKSFRCDH
ncbi:hypothetical protein MB02_11655 [Croceicoccus estronivorus]|uniref:LysR family transcriptional regulator n=1 Tax=Croceicoccus estronivorus TaxID=1172626 RepID=UPI00082B57CF|nr:LysR family transcriptional regulator [Croceicoccus estronivorus]OCC23289.1 hypothetical protein MB02_11655 [Croceicoccus estronivorus]